MRVCTLSFLFFCAVMDGHLEENTLHALFGRRLPISPPRLCGMCTCQRAFYVNTCLRMHLHSHLACECACARAGIECAICPRGGQKAPHLQEICREHRCHLEKREQRGRGDETENRGVAPLHPRTLLFQAFLIISRKKGEQCAAHTHTHSLGAAQSALSAKQKKEKNQRAERRGEGGTG